MMRVYGLNPYNNMDHTKQIKPLHQILRDADHVLGCVDVM